MKRQRITIGEDGSNNKMATFAPPAIKDDNVKNRTGSMRSARTNTALTIVPTTKPN